MPLLQYVHGPHDRQGNEYHQRNIDEQRAKAEEEFQPERNRDQNDERIDDKARLQRQQQSVHREISPAKAMARTLPLAPRRI
jgi:hypothetical protein